MKYCPVTYDDISFHKLQIQLYSNIKFLHKDTSFTQCSRRQVCVIIVRASDFFFFIVINMS